MSRLRRLRSYLGVLLAIGLVTGCASARMSDRVSDQLFREQKYDEAVAHLKQGLTDQGDNGRDLLLYLLDVGLALHSAGKYEESNQYFLKADKIAEIKDYTSLTTEGATLLTSDNIKDYKGEDFEKVLINTYLAMNYALMGDHENALVEARRVNHKLELMITQGQRKYQQNPFARYLSAVMYEADRNYNDAYVDYKKTYELDPSYPDIGRDLWRVAMLNGMEDEAADWDKEFKLTAEDHRLAKLAMPRAGKAEIVVLYENGISPIKKPNPQFREVPKFFPRPNPVVAASVDVFAGEKHFTANTQKLFDIEATAIKNLDDNYAGLVAKKLAGVVAKEVVGNTVARATKSEFLGFLTKVAFYASDQADVRSWNLLPRDLQVARLIVDPGTYQVRLSPSGASTLGEKTVQVNAGQKIFVNFRYMP